MHPFLLETMVLQERRQLHLSLITSPSFLSEFGQKKREVVSENAFATKLGLSCVTYIKGSDSCCYICYQKHRESTFWSCLCKEWRRN